MPSPAPWVGDYGIDNKINETIARAPNFSGSLLDDPQMATGKAENISQPAR